MYVHKRLLNFYRNNSFAFFLGSTWFLLINSGLFFVVKYMNNFDHRHSYLDDAVNILKLHLNYSKKDSLKLVKKKGNIDSSNNRAKCELLLLFNSEKIYLNYDDEYTEEDKDFSEYLENPYLIKKEIKFFFKKVKSFILSFISGKDNEEEEKKNSNAKKFIEKYDINDRKKVTNKDEKILHIIENGTTKWKINNIMMVKKKRKNADKDKKEEGGKKEYNDKSIYSFNNLYNNYFRYSYEICPIYGNPTHSSYYYKYENKEKTFNETQQIIGKIMLCAFFFSTFLAIKRICIYKNSYSSLNFVKNFVLNNKELCNIVGNNQIQILSISGVHEKNYINSKTFFQAKEKQGVVQITATKNNIDTTFFVLHAKVLLNSETVELKGK
ncbi:conserved Plasmodium protein, unknown function [Plasmodium malariae]|uniref:Uncharacterized protein n=1 Tax=Plasmodium malariae TaxID=5858 RepID=A0A1A8W090_PLAMA|nr:conserved Plasmodium protein, unknown function [Plasmodium malariae]